MLRDPEKEPERWKEPIVANSPEAAEKECQKRADRYECNYKEKD